MHIARTKDSSKSSKIKSSQKMAKHISQYFLLALLCIALVQASGKKHMNFEPSISP